MLVVGNGVSDNVEPNLELIRHARNNMFLVALVAFPFLNQDAEWQRRRSEVPSEVAGLGGRRGGREDGRGAKRGGRDSDRGGREGVVPGQVAKKRLG